MLKNGSRRNVARVYLSIGLAAALSLPCYGFQDKEKSKPSNPAKAAPKGKSAAPSNSTNPDDKTSGPKAAAAAPAGAAQTSVAKAASTAGADVELQGDYIPCKFTLPQLRALISPEIATTLTEADEVALKQRVIEAAISQNNDPSLSLIDLDDFIEKLSDETLHGLTPDKALNRIIQDLAASKKPPLVASSDVDALQKTLEAAIPKSKDAIDTFVEHLRPTVVHTPKDQLAGVALTYLNKVYSKEESISPQDLLSIQTVLSGIRQPDSNQIVTAARSAIGIFERPPDIGCAMSILTYDETRQAYGHLIANTYIAVQVVVRNLNRTQSFVLHDVEFEVNADPTGRLGRFFSGRDKVVVRALSAAQNSFDPRAITVHSAMGIGAIMSVAVPIFSNASLTNAAAVFSGAFIPGIDKYWKDQSADQLNLLNDTGFSSQSSSQTVVPQSGTVMFVTFIPSKQFDEGWWTQSCVDKVYLGTADDKGFVRNLSSGDSHPDRKKQATSGDETGIDVSRALEVCQLKLTSPDVDLLPRGKNDNKVLEIPNGLGEQQGKPAKEKENAVVNQTLNQSQSENTNASAQQEFSPHGHNVDLFRNAYAHEYKKWTGNSLSIFRELSNVVVSGTHIVDDTQLQPSISALNCSIDSSGNLVFPQPDKDTLTCPLTGKNLDKIAKLRLRNAKDQTDTTTAEGGVSVSGDSSSATVTFATAALHSLPQPAYDVFAVSSKGVEQKSTMTVHLATDPYVSKISPEAFDFSKDSSAKTLTITGNHLQSVTQVVLANSDSSKKVSLPLQEDALKSDAQLLVPIDPSKLTDFGTAKITLTLELSIGSKTAPTSQHFDYTGSAAKQTKPKTTSKKTDTPKATDPKPV